MSLFDDFWSQLQKEVVCLAENSLGNIKEAAISDGSDFLNKTKADIKKWTTQLAEKEITADDFEWLLKGKKDLAELVLLKEKGLAKVELDKFTNGLIDTVISTAFKVYL
jgi:hypothetical protein